MDTTQYLDVFVDESMEHLDVLYNQLLILEKDPSKEVIDEIFRAAHTVKGMAATMGFNDLETLTHTLENIFDEIRDGQINVQAHIVDILFETVDHLNDMVEDIANGGDGQGDIKQLTVHLRNIDQVKETKHIEHKDDQEIAHTRLISTLNEFEIAIINESAMQGLFSYEITVKISTDCLLKGVRAFMVFDALEPLGEIIKSDPAVNELEDENFADSFVLLFVSDRKKDEICSKINQISEIERVSVIQVSVNIPKQKQLHLNNKKETDKTNESKSTSKISQVSPRKTIRVNIDRLDTLMNLFEELVIDRARLEQKASDLKDHELNETVEHMTRVFEDLQNLILNMRMVPIHQVFNRFPGMIRQLARDLHKHINLEIIGADTELDRTVIDEISDPLVHLIRNAVDHGIELPVERKKQGKREEGTIKLRAYHSGNFVYIEIEDDGAGINKNAVVNKAIKNGILTDTQSKSLPDEQIYDLIMDSGFSTTEKVSDISGRGVGLDVVKNTIETLGGSISINSKLNEGSRFSIQLPLTLSIISVLIVKLQMETYAIPLSSVIETIKIHPDEILEVQDTKVIDYRGKMIALAFLNRIFSIPIVKENDDDLSIVIVQRGEKLVGLVVDSFIGQQEVVLKSLGNYLTDIPAISGATILGDGEVVLIIDSDALIK